MCDYACMHRAVRYLDIAAVTHVRYLIFISCAVCMVILVLDTYKLKLQAQATEYVYCGGYASRSPRCGGRGVLSAPSWLGGRRGLMRVERRK